MKIARCEKSDLLLKSGNLQRKVFWAQEKEGAGLKDRLMQRDQDIVTASLSQSITQAMVQAPSTPMLLLGPQFFMTHALIPDTIHHESENRGRTLKKKNNFSTSQTYSPCQRSPGLGPCSPYPSCPLSICVACRNFVC